MPILSCYCGNCPVFVKLAYFRSKLDAFSDDSIVYSNALMFLKELLDLVFDGFAVHFAILDEGDITGLVSDNSVGQYAQVVS